jgi:hypothetical protein
LGDKVAKLARSDSLGVKKPRPNHRVVSKSKFERLRDMDAVISRSISLAPLPNHLMI